MRGVEVQSFRIGRHKVEAGHLLTGTVRAGLNSYGEVRIDWDEPYENLDAGRFPEEVERNLPPIKDGDRILIELTVTDADPDADGEIRLQAGAGNGIWIKADVVAAAQRLDQ